MINNLYVPNKHLKLGIKIWKEMFGELAGSRELTWRFFVRNLSAKYKQSVLGYLWAIIMPFVAIGSFMFLNRAGIINIGKTDVPYPLFALIGLSVWQLFSVGIVSGCSSLLQAGSMIVKINFPRETLVFSSIAQSIFEFLIRFSLIISFFFIFKFSPSLGILLFPLALVPIIFLTLALSLILSLVEGVLRDTANIVSLLTTFLLFLTPVLYPATQKQSLFFRLNPLYPLISAPRDLIIYGHIKNPVAFFVVFVLAILLFLIFWRIFHLAETKIPERI